MPSVTIRVRNEAKRMKYLYLLFGSESSDEFDFSSSWSLTSNLVFSLLDIFLPTLRQIVIMLGFFKQIVRKNILRKKCVCYFFGVYVFALYLYLRSEGCFALLFLAPTFLYRIFKQRRLLINSLTWNIWASAFFCSILSLYILRAINLHEKIFSRPKQIKFSRTFLLMHILFSRKRKEKS